MKSVKLLSLVLFFGIFLALPQCKLWEPERVEVPCPVVESIDPIGGRAGDSITIIGRNFVQGNPKFHTLQIGSTIIPSTNYVVVNSKKIRFKVPESIGNGEISINLNNAKNCDENKVKVLFTYYYSASVELLAGRPDQSSSGGSRCGGGCREFRSTNRHAHRTTGQR